MEERIRKSFFPQENKTQLGLGCELDTLTSKFNLTVEEMQHIKADGILLKIDFFESLR